MHFVLSLILIIAAPAWAMSKQELIDLALNKSQKLKAHEYEQHFLDQQSYVQGKWQDPQVLGQFGSIKAGAKQGDTVEVSITQSIPLSNKYSLQREIGKFALERQKQNIALYKNWISHQALLSAWQLAFVTAMHQEESKRTKRLNQIKKYLENRPKVSLKQKVELAMINNQILLLEKSMSDKDYELAKARSDFHFWTGKDINIESLTWLSLKPNLILSSYQIQNTYDLELSQLQTQVEVSKMESSLAQKQKRPDLFLGGGYRQEHLDENVKFEYAIIGVNIPLGQIGNHQQQAAQAKVRLQEANYQAKQEEISNQKYSLQAQFAMAVKQMQTFAPVTQSVNQQMLQDAELGLKQGQLDLTTYLQVETQFHDTLEQSYRVKFDYLQVLSQMQLLSGESFRWEK
jgi:hypothetical protein